MSNPSELEINDDNLEKLLPSRNPFEEDENFNSVSFSDDGEKLICSSEEDSIYMVDMVKGTKEKCINSRKYGCSHVKFTNQATCALHGSSKVDNTIRYLSLNDNKYIRYFTGHQGLVTGISVSSNDMFLSTAEDRTIRLWDLKTHHCVGQMYLETSPIATFDPEGLLFAAGIDNSIIKLYDMRSFDKGPFSSFGPLRQDDNFKWTSMKCSPCGRYILIATNGDALYLIDAFNGKLKHSFRAHYNEHRIPFIPSFTPESTYVMVGSTDGLIYFYDVESGRVAKKIDAPNNQICHITEFSPAHFCAATAGASLSLWCGPDMLGDNKPERVRPLW